MINDGLMQMMKLKVLTGLIVVSTVATTSHAESKPLANKKDLVGCYERISFSPAVARQMNPIEYWHEPYQWFCFKKDGALSSLMLPYYQRQTSQSLARTFKRTPSNIRYDFLAKGMMQVQDINTQEMTYWQMTVLDENMTTSDGTLVPKNTVIMALINPKNDTIIYWRYLKKLK